MAAEILRAIHASRAALESQIGSVQVEISLIRQDLCNVVDQVTEAGDGSPNWRMRSRSFA